jgi:hypothetical protein
MGKDWEYFEHDGAYFRRDKTLGLIGVNEVRAGKRWMPYEGDPIKPAMFGDKVSEEEATRGMDPESDDE